MMLFFTPAASMRARIPSPVIVLPSISTPIWVWASKTSTPAGIFPCTQDQIEAIAPPVSASMSCSICKVTADPRPTAVKCYQGGYDVAYEDRAPRRELPQNGFGSHLPYREKYRLSQYRNATKNVMAK